jgi:hypothetical protein
VIRASATLPCFAPSGRRKPKAGAWKFGLGSSRGSKPILKKLLVFAARTEGHNYWEGFDTAEFSILRFTGVDICPGEVREVE